MTEVANPNPSPDLDNQSTQKRRTSTTSSNSSSGFGYHIRNISRKIMDQLKQAALVDLKKSSQYSDLISSHSSGGRRSRRHKSYLKNAQIAEDLFVPVKHHLYDMEPQTSPILQHAHAEVLVGKEAPQTHTPPPPQPQTPTQRQHEHDDELRRSKEKEQNLRTTTTTTKETKSSLDDNRTLHLSMVQTKNEDNHEEGVQGAEDDQAQQDMKRVVSAETAVETPDEDEEEDECSEEEERINPAYRDWKRRRKAWTNGNDKETDVDEFRKWQENGPMKDVPVDAYPNIYKMLVKDCRNLKQPMNLADAVRVMKAGWQADGTWPEDSK